MFLEFKVDVQHRNYRRFLWGKNGDIDSETHTYHMTRHHFGTTSSFGCGNFALRKIATEEEADFGMDGGNRNDRHLRCTSPLYRLDPFLDEHYLLRVGDRLNKASFPIAFRHNTPSASHMGGVEERQIRTVRNVLYSLTHDFGGSLDNESLRTFLCETMAIVNCRPLPWETSS